jgi:hypothetical protein
MVADGRLVLIEACRDVADADRLRLLCQQIEHAQARWVAEHLEALRQRSISCHRQARGGHLSAAGLILVPYRQLTCKSCVTHVTNIAQLIDVCQWIVKRGVRGSGRSESLQVHDDGLLSGAGDHHHSLLIGGRVGLDVVDEWGHVHEVAGRGL